MFGGGGNGGMPNPFMFVGGGHAGGAGSAGFNPFNLEMLFGPGGLGEADPRFIEQLFAATAGHGVMAQQPEQPRQTGPPPTSTATLRTLPRIKVTAYDITANESAECSICLDVLEMGQPALRIPCGHLFHEACVKDWLLKSNECPVCRFELPTDDAEYERGRRTRMAGRKIRLRQSDLTVKSVQELQRLAHFISVDVRGCLEKGEIVERIAASPQVHIISGDGASSSSTSLGPSSKRPSLSPAQLELMNIGEVKALADRLGIDVSACDGKAEMIARLADSGHIVLSHEHEASGGDVEMSHEGQGANGSDVVMTGAEPPEASAPPQPAAAGLRSTAADINAPLSSQSVGQLKKLAAQLGVSVSGCLEKADLVQRISAAPAFLSATLAAP